MPDRRFRIVICRGPECGDRRGSAVLHDAFRDALARHGCATAELGWQSCFGRCTQGPNVLVRELVDGPAGGSGGALGGGFATLPGPRGTTALYNRIDPDRTDRVVAQHVIGGQVVREFVERVVLQPGSPGLPRTPTKDS